jgi:hypothetical protein
MKTYALRKKTKIYLMGGKMCLVFLKNTIVELHDNNGQKEVVIRNREAYQTIQNIKVKHTVILLRRDQQIDDNVRPVSIYVNGEFIGFCNYKNPPFPLSLLY